MLVILDTNIIFQNFRFAGPQFQTLFEACSRSELTEIYLAIPQVVLEEVKKNHREQLEEHALKMSDMLRTAHKLVGEFEYPINRDTLDTTTTEYLDYIDHLFGSIGARILPLPDVSAKDIIEREMAGKKPFGRKSSGYRDFLIWNSVLAQLIKSDATVAFITDNYNDFAVGPKDGERNALHPDLLSDLQALNIEPNRVRIYNSLGELNQEVIQPILKKLDSRSMNASIESLSARVGSILRTLLEGLEPDNIKIGLRYEFEDPKIASVEDVMNFVVKDVQVLPSDQLLVSLEADALCHLFAFVDKANWVEVLEEDEASLSDWEDWNKSYNFVVKEHIIHLNISVIALPIPGAIGEILGVEIQPLK